MTLPVVPYELERAELLAEVEELRLRLKIAGEVAEQLRDTIRDQRRRIGLLRQQVA